MTTAHRPTFDHLKGKLDHNKTSIVHKRFLPAHTQLKYRHLVITEQDDEYKTANVDLNKLKKSVEEMKLELISKEQDYYKEQNIVYKDQYLQDSKQTLRLMIEDDAEDFEHKRQRILKETRDIDGTSESDGDDDDSESSSESESESDSDETELLLKELEKLKKQKQENLQLMAKEELIEKYENDEQDNGIGKSWRNETLFSNRHRIKREKKDDNFVNDMLRNEFHKKFMDKYVK